MLEVSCGEITLSRPTFEGLILYCSWYIHVCLPLRIGPLPTREVKKPRGFKTGLVHLTERVGGLSFNTQKQGFPSICGTFVFFIFLRTKGFSSFHKLYIEKNISSL
jgi:hypothetical protein